jgi:hypothetical protein
MASWVTYVAGWDTGRWVLVPLLLAAAAEAVFGFCVGCTIFGRLIRTGIVPDTICVACGDLSRRNVISEP